jgi:hypothetical protein
LVLPVAVHARDKNKTLEEVDVLFSQPTWELVKENLQNVAQTTSGLLHLRWRKVFSPSKESELPKKHGEEAIRTSLRESRRLEYVTLYCTCREVGGDGDMTADKENSCFLQKRLCAKA